MASIQKITFDNLENKLDWRNALVCSAKRLLFINCQRRLWLGKQSQFTFIFVHF